MEEKLIEAVRNRRVLYDTSHEDYLRTKLKRGIWEEVAKESDMRNGAEAKSLWEKLRHSLRDALRRQQKCLKSGAAAETIKPWKFQKQMEFLQPYTANKERDGNLQEQSTDNQIQQNTEDDVILIEEEELSQETQSENIRQEIIPSTSTATQGAAKHKRLKTDNVASLLKRSMEKREERSQVRATERRELFEHITRNQDPLFHFFMSMYETAKRMPPPLQYEVKKRVFTAVTDVEATLFNMPTTTLPQYCHSHSSPQTFTSRSTPADFLYSESSSSLNCSEQSLPPSKNSSGVNLINYINDFSE